MVIVKFPKLDIDHIEILITEEIGITIDVRLGIDIHETF